jgi:uncharacterized protein with ATP-grasp and redox domains
MPVSLDCIICLTRQSLEAARFATDDETKHAAVLKKALEIVHEKGFSVIPPLVAQEIQQAIRSESGNADPYLEQKRTSNELMLSVRDSLRKRIQDSPHSLETAIHLAIAGNTIDYAIRGDWDKNSLSDAIGKAMLQPINGNVETLISKISEAKNIIYLLDNCGEIVCDQLLLEEMRRCFPNISLTAAVRGMPVLNDATRADAQLIGLDTFVRVIDNGNDAVGTVLEICSPEFLEAFHAADMVMAKGLANYETLVEYDAEELPPMVAYLFKAKCPFIARFAGVPLGDLVVRTETPLAKRG